MLDLASSAFPLEDAYRSNGWSERIIGNWHTHPLSGDGKPSSYDRENWRDSADRRDVWVGLIVSPGDDADWPWLDPRIDAYVTSRRDMRCRSVTVVNGDYAWA